MCDIMFLAVNVLLKMLMVYVSAQQPGRMHSCALVVGSCSSAQKYSRCQVVLSDGSGLPCVSDTKVDGPMSSERPTETKRVSDREN